MSKVQGLAVGRGLRREVGRRVTGELGYRPNLGGINLRTGKTYAIGIVLSFGHEGEMNIVVASLIEGASCHMKARGELSGITNAMQFALSPFSRQKTGCKTPTKSKPAQNGSITRMVKS